MNNVRQTAKINEQELQLALQGGASWHDEYKDSAYIFIGGLPRELTEGDVISIFSQYGEVLDVNLPRDKATGKKRGFGFLMYEDQRSTVLAVDNLNGSTILERTLRVDHVKEYKQPGERDDEGNFQPPDQPSLNAKPQAIDLDASGRPSAAAGGGGDDDSDLDLEDPMAEYLARQRREGKQGSSEERAAKAQRKEERRRIREERERRRRAEKSSGRHRSGSAEGEDRHGRRDRKSSERRDDNRRGDRDGKDADAERERDGRGERPRDRDGRRDDGGRYRDEGGRSRHRSGERRGGSYDDGRERDGSRDRYSSSHHSRPWYARGYSPTSRDHERERERHGGR